MTAIAGAHTSASVRAEHDQALASLTPAQARAVARILEARTMAAYTGAGADLRLSRICDLEAIARNGLV